MIGISPVYAAEYIASHVPEARLVGQGRAQVFLWDVYDAKLYAPQGIYAENKPFALELSYLQKIAGREIADHAVREMRRLGYKNEKDLLSWHRTMSDIFPNVIPGSTIAGISTPDGATIFYEDGEAIGRIDAPHFGKEFFRIWLDAGTSTPELRYDLLNIDSTMEGHRDEASINNHRSGGRHDN
jgi:hypothetical protein